VLSLCVWTISILVDIYLVVLFVLVHQLPFLFTFDFYGCSFLFHLRVFYDYSVITVFDFQYINICSNNMLKYVDLFVKFFLYVCICF
jgi:hypothetical protein